MKVPINAYTARQTALFCRSNIVYFIDTHFMSCVSKHLSFTTCLEAKCFSLSCLYAYLISGKYLFSKCDSKTLSIAKVI